MALKYCQGPDCHTYYTQDRLKGIKGSKTFQTRRRSRLLYDAFCDTRCQNDWLSTNIVRALNHFGRVKEVKHLTEQNAWVKDYDYRGYNNNEPDRYYFVNKITEERRPLTEEQYRDTNYTLNTGE